MPGRRAPLHRPSRCLTAGHAGRAGGSACSRAWLWPSRRFPARRGGPRKRRRPRSPVPPPVPPARPERARSRRSRRSRERPGAPATKERSEARAGEEAAEDAKPEIPIPPPPTPPGRPPELSGEAALALKVAPPDDTACRTRLKRLGVDFEPLPPIAEGQCTAPLPLKVTRLRRRGCAAAGRDADLPRRRGPGALGHGGAGRGGPDAQAPAHRTRTRRLLRVPRPEPRRRCQAERARVRECGRRHGLRLRGPREPFRSRRMPEGSDEAQFLGAVRTKACGFFRTVLGPGSNAAHANHLHLDERERSAGHRLCE